MKKLLIKTQYAYLIIKFILNNIIIINENKIYTNFFIYLYFIAPILMLIKKIILKD